MEIIQKGNTIAIKPSRKIKIRKELLDGFLILFLIWALYGIMVLYFSQSGTEVLPYFIAVSLLLIIPYSAAQLVRISRYYKEICIDGMKNIITSKGLWKKKEIPFDTIRKIEVCEREMRKRGRLSRIDVVVSSGKRIPLIRDVPDRDALVSLGKKIEKLIGKELRVKPLYHEISTD